MTSTIAHLALLIVLALVAVQSQPDEPPLALVVDNPSTTELNLLPEYELMASPAPVESLPAAHSQQRFNPLPVVLPDLAPLPRVSESDEAATSPVDQAADGLAMSIQRRVSQAGGRRGEVQFALAWKNVNDVDLHVIAPSGERISHMHRRSKCQGMLDVDMNVRAESEEPVENIRWLQRAPAGRYTVLVNLFRIHRARSASSRLFRGSEFQLLAQLGNQSRLERGIVNRREQLAVFRYQYVPDSVLPPQRAQLLAALAELQEREEQLAQPALEIAAKTSPQHVRNRLLNSLISRYPHTDAAIEAMRLLGGSISKTDD